MQKGVVNDVESGETAGDVTNQTRQIKNHTCVCPKSRDHSFVNMSPIAVQGLIQHARMDSVARTEANETVVRSDAERLILQASTASEGQTSIAMFTEWSGNVGCRKQWLNTKG